VTLALVRWLLRRHKRRLERHMRAADYERRHSLELDRVIAALDVLEVPQRRTR
jgi:hypothetical protein